MAMVQKSFVVSIVVGTLFSLVNCSKPGERRLGGATASPPATTEAPAAAVGTGDGDKAARAAQKRAEAVLAAANLFNNEPSSAAKSAPVGGDTGVIVLADAATVPQPAQQAASEAAPAAQSPASQSAAVEPAASGNTGGMSVPVPTFNETMKREFVIAAIEPVMRLNAKVYRERYEIERLQAKVGPGVNGTDKAQLAAVLMAEEVDWLMRVKAKYQLAETDSFQALLARVDGVKMAFLIAPAVLATGWQYPKEDADKFFAYRMELLNTNSGDQYVRFRTARENKAARAGQNESVALMQAFLGMQNDVAGNADALVMVVNEINGIVQEPEADAKIKQVYELLINEIPKK